MKFYTKQHQYYCGINLHARTMYVCILDQTGRIVVERNMACAPEPFLTLIAPYREDVVIGVECIFTWYWLADLCAREQLCFILGHALYMKAIHACQYHKSLLRHNEAVEKLPKMKKSSFCGVPKPFPHRRSWRIGLLMRSLFP